MARRPRPLVAGNWKMNGLKADLVEVEKTREALVAGVAGEAEVLVCPPSTLIAAAADIARGSDLKIGGQNCHKNESGPHTGSISPGMLVDAGATYVILGHSERRADHHETNAAVKVKAVTAKAAGLTSIICVGETKEDRDLGRAHLVVRRQIQGSLPTDIDARQLVVAYEPIWAIGTGVTPSCADIAEMHAFMRKEVMALIPEGGDTIRLLYGGSVKPSNAAEILAVENVDGALVGGASLKSKDFMAIAAVYAKELSTAG
ncbi:MAG: triose-phosphate isomerase [Beijerinckiaceae bacterium]|jgi:triosephosphate isomerase (TIM)|nr:triose-phosphate isomerase [Beijerinckiaceae bacterium]